MTVVVFGAQDMAGRNVYTYMAVGFLQPTVLISCNRHPQLCTTPIGVSCTAASGLSTTRVLCGCLCVLFLC